MTELVDEHTSISRREGAAQSLSMPGFIFNISHLPIRHSVLTYGQLILSDGIRVPHLGICTLHRQAQIV